MLLFRQSMVYSAVVVAFGAVFDTLLVYNRVKVATYTFLKAYEFSAVEVIETVSSKLTSGSDHSARRTRLSPSASTAV